ncbi:MAG: alpha-D-ribose 1-methylphosphonate 5-triphosphate diphosphatase [Treponema sp.]|nr:alpha-D-ribose 1-methylphosphonate 5-triphosphate diphosphatase [Treponema sp.]
MRIFSGARIVTESSVLEGHELAVCGNRIAAIGPAGSTPRRGAEIVQLDGAYLMPGLIDIHADYIERMAAPRPTRLMDFALAVREAERELVTHGITTMFHSLSFHDYSEFLLGEIRLPEHTRRLVAVISEAHDGEHLIRHRLHARFEIDSGGRLQELRSYIEEGKVHLLSFMDHSPGQGQYRNLEIYRKTLQGYHGMSDEEAEKRTREVMARERIDFDEMAFLARFARSRNVAVASHDDDSVDKLALVRDFGATISEFPIMIEVARAAKAAGMHTVAGATNVLMNGSHSGNMSATQAVMEDVVDILCSDYYPAALLHAVFKLHCVNGLPLHRAASLATINPARAVLMDGELGSLEVGKRADLLAVRMIGDDFPVVSHAVIDGSTVFVSSYRR